MSADLQFKQLIDRVLRCREAEDAAKEDTKQVYADAKAKGFDKTAMGALVAELRKKDKNPEKFEERNSILDLYRDAYERASHTHTREATQSVPATSRPFTPLAARGADESAASNPVANVGEGANGAIAAAPGDPASRDDDGADRQQPVPSGFTGEGDGRDVEAVGGAASVTTISDADVPAFLKKDRDPINERCENPQTCKFGRHPQKITCSTCSTAWAIAQKSRAA